MTANDPLPRFVVRWSDSRAGFLFESRPYLVREQADFHFSDLIGDPTTQIAEEIERTARREVVLRSWRTTASTPRRSRPFPPSA